jgi:hypothetical protein
MFSMSRDGIVSAGMERMTPAEARKSQPNAAPDAMPLDGFPHVFRTRWMIPAGGRQQRGDSPFVDAEAARHELAHLEKTFRTSASISGNDASSRGFRGLNTIDHSGGNDSRLRRTASRMRRFILLRMTDFPIARDTVKPTRGPSCCSGSRRQKAAKSEDEKRVP